MFEVSCVPVTHIVWLSSLLTPANSIDDAVFKNLVWHKSSAHARPPGLRHCFCLFYFSSLVLPCNTLLLGTLIAAGLDQKAFVKKHRKKLYLNSSYLPNQSLGREVNWDESHFMGASYSSSILVAPLIVATKSDWRRKVYLGSTVKRQCRLFRQGRPGAEVWGRWSHRFKVRSREWTGSGVGFRFEGPPPGTNHFL